jgi:polysaccharide export outer membrane protein
MGVTRTVLMCAAALSLAACGGAGPQTGTILKSKSAELVDRTRQDEPFVLVDVGLNFAERLAYNNDRVHWHMPKAGPAAFAIGVNDVIDISIVSSNDTGFIDFSQGALSPISTTSLPRQTVASDGTVAVPLLGRIKASGRSVQSLEKLLTRRLSEVLVNPTAIVQLVERQSATVSLIGAGITTPGTYPINLSDRRLLDVIGRAGGPEGEAKDIIVSLVRSGVTYQAVLYDIYSDPAHNIYIHKGDLISLEPRTTRVQVVGATGANSNIEVEEIDVTLMDVLSEAGGLNSPRADLEGVFVFRRTPPKQLQNIGADVTAFAGHYTVPTIFRFDMTQPTAFFTAEAFQMRDDDILYVADSTNAKLSNFFEAIGYFAPTPAVYVQDATLGN